MTSIRKELKEYGLLLKKGLGQNLLIDRNIMEKVVRTAQVEKGDIVLEVGPGLGEMTLALAQRAKQVIAIEIDSRMVEILREKLRGHSNIEVIKKDILKVDFRELIRGEDGPIKVVSNLPYQISTPLLFRFIESREIFSTLTLMLQREVAERIQASPGGKEYGPLSIFIQIFLNISTCFRIHPSVFFPPPKVESAVVRLIWKERPMIDISHEKWFKTIVRACFRYRRKTIANALKNAEISDSEAIEIALEKTGIDPQRRPETLTIQEYIKLAETLKDDYF